MLRYELYGLPSGNPYVSAPLDPFAIEDHRDLLLELEGFIRLSRIEEALREAVETEKTAFFLINGVGNSGRTSLANHIMYRYERARSTRLPGFELIMHCAERGELTHDTYRTLRSTLLSLRNKLRARQIDIPAPLAEMFTELSRRPLTEALDDYDLQEIAGYAASRAAVRDLGFGIRYEGVPTKELVTRSTKVFEGTGAVVAFVVDDYQHANTVQFTEADRQEFTKRGLIADLTPLTAAQVAALAHCRWTGHPPSPFDPQGVRAVFRERLYPIGHALRHLQMLLDFRLSEYDGEESWPCEDLHIHENWLRVKMWQGERWSAMGGVHA